MELVKEIKKLDCGLNKKEEDFSKHTTYKTSGKIKLVVYPKTIEQLIKLKKFLIEHKIKHMIIGKGSNLIFCNHYYDGVLINLEKFNQLEIVDTKIRVGSGYSITKLAHYIARLGFSGLEFAAGIPGSVGGSVYMNAGAYGSDMSVVVESVKVLTPDYKIKKLSKKQLNFAYRTSFLHKNKDYICLEVTFNLKKDKTSSILWLIEDRKKRRWQSQPLEFPSAGSVFRNPENDFAGRLIEELDLKGHRIGDAMVSEKHANFIVNVGRAEGKDIKKLILFVKGKVYQKYLIDLHVEQEFVE